ncbi:unnamed protein product [Umbelopsis sp. WA50703]
MLDSGLTAEILRVVSSTLANMTPKIRKRFIGIFAFAKHPRNWPNGLQFRDYEIVSLAVAILCDENASPGLLECADFSDIGLIGPNTKTGVCLAMLQEQPLALQRVATLCVYAYMMGDWYAADELLKRTFTITVEMRKELDTVCQSPTQDWRVKLGLEQWTTALKKDIKAWMHAHNLPISKQKSMTDRRQKAFRKAYDGDFRALCSLIEKETDRLPMGVTGLQFSPNHLVTAV